MKNIQDIFTKIKEASKEQREIRREYKDALVQETEYAKIIEDLEQLKEKKKKIEEFVQGSMGSRYEQLEDLKHEVTELKTMQSDIAVTTLMKGENIAVKDEYDNIYEPQFSVTFKKTDAKAE